MLPLVPTQGCCLVLWGVPRDEDTAWDNICLRMEDKAMFDSAGVLGLAGRQHHQHQEQGHEAALLAWAQNPEQALWVKHTHRSRAHLAKSSLFPHFLTFPFQRGFAHAVCELP